MITVIIATYNAQSNIQKTIDSLKSQTIGNFELIIVDGASNDDTITIIKSNGHFITKFLSEPDNGLYEAWNKGIKMCSGEWLCFIGAGDTLFPEAFSEYEKLIAKSGNNFDYISAKVNRTDHLGCVLSVIGKPWIWKDFKKTMTVAHVGSLHNRKLLDEVGLFDTNYKICSDYELLLRKGDKLKTAYLDHIIGNMPVGGVSHSVKALKEYAQVRRRTGHQSWFNVYLNLMVQYVLLKTYKIRKQHF